MVFYEKYFSFHSIDSAHDLLDCFPDTVLPSITSYFYAHHLAQYALAPTNNNNSIEHYDPHNVEPISASSFDCPQNQDSNPDSNQPFLTMPRRPMRVSKPPSFLPEFHVTF